MFYHFIYLAKGFRMRPKVRPTLIYTVALISADNAQDRLSRNFLYWRYDAEIYAKRNL